MLRLFNQHEDQGTPWDVAEGEEFAPRDYFPRTPAGYFLGLDLGQAQDYTAAVLVCKLEDYSSVGFEVPFLKRWPLGVPYTVIVPVHGVVKVGFNSIQRWSACWQQRRDLLASQMRRETRTEIPQHVALLLPTGSDHRQHPLDKPAAIGTVRATADPPPDHGMSQRAFRGVIRRLNPFDAGESPQAFLHLEDLKVGRCRLGAAASLALFECRFDLAPQPHRHRLQPLPIDGPVAEAVPPAKHPLGQAQQRAPGGLTGTPAVDHRLEVAIQVRPADLSPRRIDPLQRAVAVAGDNLVRLTSQHRSGHRGRSFGRDGENRGHCGHDHPQLGLAAVFAPRGVVDAGRRGVVDAQCHFVVRGLQHCGRLPFELGDHTRGDGQPEQVADHLLDLALAQAVAAGERGQHRLQIRAETSSGNSDGEAPTGGYAALGAGQAMKPVLVDQGLDPGQFGDLMNQGGRVLTDQGMATAAAIRGPAIGDRAYFLRWNQTAFGPAMSRLPTPLPPRGPGRRLPFEADGIRRRRLGGIGGIELEAGLQIADALLQFNDPTGDGVQDGQDGGLGFRRHGLPERFSDGRLGHHT